MTKSNKENSIAGGDERLPLFQAIALFDIDKHLEEAGHDRDALLSLAGDIEDDLRDLRNVVEEDAAIMGRGARNCGYILTSLPALVPVIVAGGFAQNATPLSAAFALVAGVVAGAGLAYGSVRHAVPRFAAYAQDRCHGQKEEEVAPFYAALEKSYKKVQKALEASGAFNAAMDEDVVVLPDHCVIAVEENNEGGTVYRPGPGFWKNRREP